MILASLSDKYWGFPPDSTWILGLLQGINASLLSRAERSFLKATRRNVGAVGPSSVESWGSWKPILMKPESDSIRWVNGKWVTVLSETENGKFTEHDPQPWMPLNQHGIIPGCSRIPSSMTLTCWEVPIASLWEKSRGITMRKRGGPHEILDCMCKKRCLIYNIVGYLLGSMDWGVVLHYYK